MDKISTKLEIIGIVHSPYKTTSEAPRQGTDDTSIIEIVDEFMDGLRDIEDFSHLHIIYWLHKSKGYNLIVHTPWDTKPHGLFTTRSPNRPNPIGHAVVELINRKESKLYVKGLDAIEGTAVIDIKPYVKKLDIRENANEGWIEKTGLNRN